MTPKNQHENRLNEARLMARVSQGDKRAAETLVRAHGAQILAFARRCLRDPQEAEDVTQETFLRLWKEAAQWNAERGRLQSWLYAIALNLMRSHMRRAKPLPLDEDKPLPDERPSPLRNAIGRETASRLRTALDLLPQRQRIALDLAVHQGMSHRQIGKIIGASSEAVESLVARARRALRSHLEEQQIPPKQSPKTLAQPLPAGVAL